MESSPLKRVERPAEFKSRFAADWELLLSGRPLSSSSSGTHTHEASSSQQLDAAASKSLDAFFADLFCLTAKPQVVEQLVERETASSLLARRANLGLFFTSAIAVLKDSDKHDVRRWNALQCLLPFMKQLLRKPFPNYNFDLISILCGSLEQSDLVLSVRPISLGDDFVATLDEILRDEECQPQVRRRALQIILVMTCQIGQGSLVSYFLRRDFFFTLCGFITLPECSELQIEAQLLLGALANYHKFETRNLYLVRLEDLVEDQVMRTVIDTTTQALKEAQQAYIDIEDDAPPSFVATLSSIMASLRISDYLPSSSSFTTTTSSPRKASAGSSTPSERAFGHTTPPPQAVLLLLPFYDLLHRNKLFLSLALDSSSTFAPTFLSFASYALCHASTSPRARSYGRLCLVTMTRLVEEGPVPTLASDDLAAQVRLCRQRKPQLPYVNDQNRPLLCALLDDTLVYLRHNIQKQLDVESHLLAVQLVHKVLHGLKSSHIRLDYDWVPLWRALVTLGTFIVNKIEHLKSLPDLDELIARLLTTLDFACLYSDVLFTTSEGATMLFYEILRAEQIIKELGDMTGASGIQQPSLSASTSSRRTLSTDSSAPTSSQSVRNLKAVIAHFSTALDEHQEGGQVLESEEVLKILDRSAENGVDLVDSAALEDIRSYEEIAHEASFKLVLRDAMQDALELVFGNQLNAM